MANALYPLFKQSLLAGDANADLDNNTATDGVYAVLVDTGTYTYSGPTVIGPQTLEPSLMGSGNVFYLPQVLSSGGGVGRQSRFIMDFAQGFAA